MYSAIVSSYLVVYILLSGAAALDRVVLNRKNSKEAKENNGKDLIDPVFIFLSFTRTQLNLGVGLDEHESLAIKARTKDKR